mgnify:CR=1 FL=1
MALTENEGNGFIMPVAPSNSGFGGFGGGDGLWILILFILLAGNGGFGGNGGFCGGNLYPWLNNTDNINGGFRDQLLNSNITAINAGIAGLNTQLCNGFAGTAAAINNGFAQSEIAANARQMADMNQNFALQSALQNCCCENRASIADLKFTVATENCADRAAVASALQEVIAANTASTQRILDQMCADRIEAKNERIADLERQLTLANLAASQTSQTAKLIADNTAQTQYIVNRVAPYPIPAYTVANPITPATT